MKIHSPIEEKKARIEIIPLIDIMFFLLACFMIVSLKMIQMRGVKVDLPGAAVSQPVKKSDFISVSVDAQGTIYYQKTQTDTPSVVDKLQLEELLKEASGTALKNGATEEPPRVYIRADKDSLHGEVMEILDAAKVAGITKVAFEIKNQSVTAPVGAAPAPVAPAPAAAPAAPAPPVAPAPAQP